MLVTEIATKEVRTTHPDSSLSEAGVQLRNADCGALPVVDQQRKLVGIITDRDICLALTKENTPASLMTVEEAMSHSVEVCAPGDDIGYAIELMVRHHVGRLPVCSSEGLLLGIVTLSDILLAGGPEIGGLDDRALLTILRLIVSRRRAIREARMIEEHPTV